MNSNGSNRGGYTKSEMYPFVHNTVLPNLKKSGLNITACDLVSYQVYNDICSKTGKTGSDITGGENFWLTDTYSSDSFNIVYIDGIIHYNHVGGGCGVRPLITVVK